MKASTSAKDLKKIRQFKLLVISVLIMSIFAFSALSLPRQVHAATIVELSPSNGSTVCPTYLKGPGVLSTQWNMVNSTCTVVAQPNVTPTLCIASFNTGCSAVVIDQLLIDAGVTLVMTKVPTSPTASVLCVYSMLGNSGTIKGGSICDYGTISNYGTVNVPTGNFLETLPYNGFGILNNNNGALIANSGTIDNSGTLNNYCGGSLSGNPVSGNPVQFFPCSPTITSSGTFTTATPTISGTSNVASGGSSSLTITLYDGTTIIGSTTTSASGDWTITTTRLSQGSHTLTATATNAQGHTSPLSAPVTVTITRHHKA